MGKLLLATVLCICVGSPSVYAGLLARIGDADGFGYGDAPGFLATNRKPAKVHDVNVLGNLDFLPDINKDRMVRTGGGDDFDLRKPAERNDVGYSFSAGVSNTQGMKGSKFTDISLSTSYGANSAASKVLVGGNPESGLKFGAGGAFPFPRSDVLPIQPGFVFSFDIDKAKLASQTPIFFNMIFGDYDVSPAKITITRANGTTQSLTVSAQPTAADGLIQNATASLKFSDVFTDGGSVWHGFLKVDFKAPKEPYTAFDYVELSTIALEQGIQNEQPRLGRRGNPGQGNLGQVNPGRGNPGRGNPGQGNPGIGPASPPIRGLQGSGDIGVGQEPVPKSQRPR